MAKPTMDPHAFVRKLIEDAEPDVLREMVQTFAETLMSAEASAIAGAGYGERSGASHPPQGVSHDPRKQRTSLLAG